MRIDWGKRISNRAVLLMLHFFVPLLFLVGGALGRGLLQNEQVSVPPMPFTAVAVNNFGFDLLRELRARNSTQNVVFSPLSISSAFGLLYFGAMDKIRNELENVFGFKNGTVPKDLLDIAVAFGEGSNETAIIANRVYVDDDIQVLQSYIQAVGQQLIQRLNFADSEASRSIINLWVENVTRGFITDLLPEGTINANTKLVLLNAIYFKALWERPFDKNSTVPLDFRGAGGNTKIVDFMTLDSGFFLTKSVPELNSTILELPYQGGRFSMFILLPNEDDGYLAAEAALANDLNLFEDLFPIKFDRVQIPKWELEQEMRDIKSFLMNLGMQDAFTGGPDLSGISSTTSLEISDVIHKAKIIVDEEGTEAAAATAIVIAFSLAPSSEFIADHPFIYFIVDKQSDQIFFQGTVTGF